MTTTSSEGTPTFPRPALSLRERKKQQTRAAIQREGLRLFRERGYGETTCEEIAAAANVSPATFFRYFPTKEDVVLTDDYDPLFVEALQERPEGEPAIVALREAIEATFRPLIAADEDALRERTELMLSVPALRARFYEGFVTTTSVLAAALSPRINAKPEELRSRGFSYAVAAALMAAAEQWVEDGGDLTALAIQVLDEVAEEFAAGVPRPGS